MHDVKADIGDFVLLKVASIESIGAFLDWGRDKELFLPFSEQLRKVEVGHLIVVYIYLDKADRPTATMRVEKYLEKTGLEYQPNDAVDLLVYSQTEHGYKVIINNQHQGVIYKNEVFKPIEYGEQLKGYVKQVREDGKVDLSLQRLGFESTKDIAPIILQRLKENDGFLPINDKTDADKIHELFGVSKKKYKMALGGLYKKRLISVHDDGIRLVK
ncbi:MAG: S1 RNA-binding domain-containing protein [Bdellovibrionales bacterium]